MIAAICDDEPLFRRTMLDFLIAYKQSRRIHLDIVECSDGKELLAYEYPCDIVFLDYEMPILDGMETARQLRAKKSLCCIIFVTSFPQYVFESFEVNTYRYLVKPIDFQKLEQVLDDYIKDKKLHAPIVVNVDGEQRTISSEDVVYLEADGKYCNIRTATDYVHSSKTLAQIFALLPPHCFYRVHKSYAVNFYCIGTIQDHIIVLTNGEKIKLSRNKMTDFKEAYKAFLKHFIWKH